MKRFLRKVVFNWPWHIAMSIFRLLYGFQVEGAENVPSEGPFILALNEFSPVATLVSGWISIVLLGEAISRNPDNTVSYLQEELFAFAYFRKALDEGKGMARKGYAPLKPHAAGRLALSLLDGYRVLQNDGLVIC